MLNKFERFSEALRQQKPYMTCEDCPCVDGCRKLSEDDGRISCDLLLYLYVEHNETENFEKYLTND